MNLSEETIRHMGIEPEAWDAASDVERTRAIELYVVRGRAAIIVDAVGELADAIERLNDYVPDSQVAYKIANGEVPFESIHDYIRDYGEYVFLRNEGYIDAIKYFDNMIAEAQDMIQSMTYKWGDENTITHDLPCNEAMNILARLASDEMSMPHAQYADNRPLDEYLELFRWLKEHGDDGDEYPGYDE